MTIKIQKTAFENALDNGNYLANTTIKNQVCTLIKYKITGLAQGVLIPDSLINEAEKFIERNMKEEMSYQFCPRCLKAHLIKKADEMGLTIEEKKYIESKFIEEAGHHGYYMDGENLILI